MTLANAKVLYKHLMEIGRVIDAKNLEKRYPELAEKEVLGPPKSADQKPKPKPKKELPPPPEKKGLLERAKEAIKK